MAHARIRRLDCKVSCWHTGFASWAEDENDSPAHTDSTAMNLSSFVLEASEQDYREAFDAHPVFLALQNGTFNRSSYLSYLRETFHLIRHTTSTFARAVSHVPDEQ